MPIPPKSKSSTYTPGKMITSLRSILRNGRNALFNNTDFHRSMECLKKLENAAHQPEDWLNIPFTFRGYGEYQSIRPKQVFEEIRQLHQILVNLSPRNVCEIGTFAGGTFYLWCKAARLDATLISIDLPGGLENSYTLNRIAFYKQFARSESQHLHFIPADSHLDSTACQVINLLQGQLIDFLFIDGDHQYKGVKRDFELYSPFVRQGGIVAFHDILSRPDTPDVQVYKLWNEIKAQFRSQEIIAQEGKFARMIGIGIVWVE